MPEDRISSLEAEHRVMRAEVNAHSNQIAVLNAQIPDLRRALDANTEALKEHGQTLNEYTGARKAVHWIVTTLAALSAYFLGKGGAQ